jgi:glycosyltransferase involved in cell wall biosynthesis
LSGGDVFYFNTWYRGHNNARYEELLPRLARVRPYLLTYPRARLLRAGSERTWRLLRGGVEPAVLRRLQKRYRHAFVTDVRQLAHVEVPALVDIDDLEFTLEDAALLRRENVVAYTVTAESAARRLGELGVDKPWHVIPQGVALDRLDPADVAATAAERGGRRIVGYLAAFLLVPGDRGGENPIYDVSHLIDLWEQIRAAAPGTQLWLVGAPSARVRARLAGRADVRLFGRVPRPRLLSIVSCFDVALYPRTYDPGIRASKVAEYLGAGVPVVGYDHPVVDDVRAADAGILVSTPAELVDAVTRLLDDEDVRSRLAAAAAAEGRRRDWRVLAAEYAALLDRHLPRA